MVSKLDKLKKTCHNNNNDQILHGGLLSFIPMEVIFDTRKKDLETRSDVKCLYFFLFF